MVSASSAMSPFLRGTSYQLGQIHRRKIYLKLKEIGGELWPNIRSGEEMDAALAHALSINPYILPMLVLRADGYVDLGRFPFNIVVMTTAEANERVKGILLAQ
jgi:hypothetical protein